MKSKNHQLVIKLPIGDLFWGLIFLGLGIGDFLNPENTNSKFKIINWLFYHQLVIFTFTSLLIFYANLPSKMADFCTIRISTVTGQVSLMPQTAVDE